MFWLIALAAALSAEEYVSKVLEEVHQFEGLDLSTPIGQFPESSSWSIVDPEMTLVDYYVHMGSADSYPVVDRFYYIDHSGQPLASEAIDFDRMEIALNFAKAHNPDNLIFKDVQDFKDKAHADLDSAIAEARKSTKEFSDYDVSKMVKNIKEALAPEQNTHNEL